MGRKQKPCREREPCSLISESHSSASLSKWGLLCTGHFSYYRCHRVIFLLHVHIFGSGCKRLLWTYTAHHLQTQQCLFFSPPIPILDKYCTVSRDCQQLSKFSSTIVIFTNNSRLEQISSEPNCLVFWHPSRLPRPSLLLPPPNPD